MRLTHSSLTWLALAAVTLVVVEAQRECIKYLSSAEGLFKKPFYMKSHYQNSMITNVTLIERHSYYKCEPAEDKYGIDSTGKEWWVFRGCGGVFDIEECTEGGSLQLKVKEEIPAEQRDMEKKTMQEFGVLQTSAEIKDFEGSHQLLILQDGDE
ncbi:uncharacterized protein LOC117339335 isoform X1 [Pecten maximus]|uniref:uncharacterized protein LOC117339335 isoform X1 n=1 Tax=Pecten maximus TaxID=6579 RepID=UPI00145858AD|nr:uncharacterized protein LOC117339335 isoform X1 [Pecten maximus]XP_033756759.1 uncharacterized protein LOC117339335 isoform X1 [Pecten maximus]